MINQIRETFASIRIGRYQQIKFDTEMADTWIFKRNEDYGVAVLYEGEMIYEQFANVILKSEIMNLVGGARNVLALTCSVDALRNEFSVIASQFIEPGEGNQNREDVTANPQEWWSRWSTLIGNVMIERNAYDIIAEMMVLEHLQDIAENPEWKGPLGGSQDIMSNQGPVEVKSTIRKYGAIISINSQFQLAQNEEKMRLYFVRLEKSNNGMSVADMIQQLIHKGVDAGMLSRNIEKSGIHKGSSLWKEKYEVLERRIYQVGKDFPVISPDSFKEGKIPDGIVKIHYEVDLDSIRYDVW